MIAAAPGRLSLDSGEKPPAPGNPPELVVHSDHEIVTKMHGPATLPALRAWFHEQVVDSNEIVTVGTFLTKSPIKPVFPCARACTRVRCTDLSTCDVDKGKTLGSTVTCAS